MEFRTLRADEIEVRVGTVNKNGARLLLYKDARCDMAILDEALGCMGWQRHHSRDNANCTVSIWDKDKGQWIEKEDTGTESNTEKEKGLASDSFKRACVNVGIGRELYTAPNISIKCPTKQKSDKAYELEDRWQFYGCKVSKIEYDDKRNISSLTIVDKDGMVIFTYPKEPYHKPSPKQSIDELKEKVRLLAKTKKVSMSEIIEISRFDDFEKFDEAELNGCLEWLKGQ